MKLAESSRQKLEAFFREYLRDEDFCLPVIHFYAGTLTRVFTNLIGVHGIAFGRHIFINPLLVTRSRRNQPQLSADLAAHEIAHTLQYRREGGIKFLYRYTSDYRKNLNGKSKQNAHSRQEAYMEIPFEIEARAVASKFVEWRKSTANGS